VSYFQLYGSSDKFAAIPPTRGRLYGKEVTDCSNCKHRPTYYAVIKFKIFHSNYIFLERKNTFFFDKCQEKCAVKFFFNFFEKKVQKNLEDNKKSFYLCSRKTKGGANGLTVAMLKVLRFLYTPPR
jgi:hypothetical protein